MLHDLNALTGSLVIATDGEMGRIRTTGVETHRKQAQHGRRLPQRGYLQTYRSGQLFAAGPAI